MKWMFVAILMSLVTWTWQASGQQAEINLITPDTGPIRVDWTYRFVWSDDDELNLVLTLPTNIEIMGHTARPTGQGLEYTIKIHDLFIKLKALMLGDRARILSSHGLTIQINDQGKGIIKTKSNCPSDLHAPLFSRSILVVDCTRDDSGISIRERGYINGERYTNQYHRSSYPTVAAGAGLSKGNGTHHVNEGAKHKVNWVVPYAGMLLELSNQEYSSAGDGIMVRLQTGATVALKKIELIPYTQLSLFNLQNRSHHQIFKHRKDDIGIKSRWHPLSLPQIDVDLDIKTFARTHNNHYLVGAALGSGFHYLILPKGHTSIVARAFPALSSRDYQLYQLGVELEREKSSYQLAFEYESYDGGSVSKIKSYGIVFNVTQRF